ncbi:tyrosyl-DNA phosphodiesterase-domain-containing protein [Xylariaceae sp. FL0255]|nr:tyrosyl-DNA phosphodiesterase-domain-containing protein [Xylariaceae sp. FL0255]
MDASEDDHFDDGNDIDATMRYAIALSLVEGDINNNNLMGDSDHNNTVIAEQLELLQQSDQQLQLQQQGLIQRHQLGQGQGQPIEIKDSGDDDPEPEPKSDPKAGPSTRSTHSTANKNNDKTAEEAQSNLSKPNMSKQKTGSSTGMTGLGGLGGLDRKKMEEERLARAAAAAAAAAAAKRKAGAAGIEDVEPPSLRLKRSHESGSAVSRSVAPPTGDVQARVKAHDADPGTIKLPFPKGVVKKTWASGFPRKDDDIKIEEVFQKDKLQLAVLSSFQWDDDFLLSKIDIRKTKIVCIAFATNEAHQEEMRANVPRDRIRFCFPPMGPAGSMHSKLQLLKFPGYMRIVIPTGNLVPYDWGETGMMENMVFLIDLPLITNVDSRPSKPATLFGQELCYFLEASDLGESLIKSLTTYDFSETERYRFVHTIGTSHMGEEWRRTGYCGLGRAIKSMGLDTASNIELDLVVASLGSLKKDLISAIYNAAQGDDGLKEYDMRTGKGVKKKIDDGNRELDSLAGRFRIYFPSRDTVNQSRGGRDAGGTICVQRKWWDSATFPRQMIRDCKSVRPGLLMHSKILLVRHRKGGEGGKPDASWVYVGSANLSESAWGRLVKDKTSGQPKLNCRNWECGVVIPIPGSKEGELGTLGSGGGDGGGGGSGGGTTDAKDLKSCFEPHVPVPMVVPGEAYGRTGSKQPWFFLEPRS